MNSLPDEPKGSSDNWKCWRYLDYAVYTLIGFGILCTVILLRFIYIVSKLNLK